MTTSYIEQERRKYFHYWQEGSYCVGSKKDCRAYGEAVKHLAWNENAAPGDVKRIRFLPTLAQVKKMQLPTLTKALEKLEFIQIPYPMIGPILNEIIHKSPTLCIANNMEYVDKLNIKEFRWPEGLCAETLEGLIFLGDYDSGVMWHHLKIPEKALTNLKYLKTAIDKKGLIINEISKFKTTEHVELNSLNKLDVFPALNPKLRVIQLNSATKDFPIEKLADFSSLEVINLLHVKAEIDCSMFTKLKNLKEINFNTCKKMLNVKSLLEIDSLKSVEITDCANPLKKDGTLAFSAKGFERLDIKYA